MGPISNGGTRGMGYRGMGHMGNRGTGVWGTRGMGHIGNGSHGQWGTGVWVMGPHCPCAPLAMLPIDHVAHTPCTPYPLWASLPICPIPPHPIPHYFAPVSLIAHVPHIPCTPLPPVSTLPIGLIAHTPCTPLPPLPIWPITQWGVGVVGNGTHGAIVYRGYGVQRVWAYGQWGQRGMGHMGNRAHGQ